LVAGIGTKSNDDDPAAATSPLTYQVTVMESSQGVARLSIQISATDPFIEQLRHAVELRIVWPRDPNVSNVSVNNWPEVLDLRHFSLGNVWTWKNVIGANDTYGAIKTVLDCVSQHTPFR
jgi:hypothetical protein